MRDTFTCALLLGLLSCTGDDIVDPNAEADSDTDTDTDTDTDADADTDTDTDTDRTDNTLTMSVGSCSYDVSLQLTRITLDGGEYYNYEEAFLSENLGTDCAGDVLLPTPDKDDLAQFSDDYPDTYWAIYLPALYADVGATLDVTIESSPEYASSDDTGGAGYSTVGELSDGNAYVAISDELLVYVDGTLDQILQDLGLEQGWNVLEIDGTDLSTVKQTQAGVTISLTSLNLELDYDSITISGEPRRTDTTYSVGARPYGWMLQTDTTSSAFDGLTFDLEGNTSFELTVSGAPPADHYMPAETVYDIDDFESCCQDDVPRAVEMPIIYFEDDDKTLTFSDEADGGICNDERHILLLHNPYPTHLWLAQWYLNNNEDPGWYVRYGDQEEWWKDLDRGSYGILNLSTTCDVFADWALTSL